MTYFFNGGREEEWAGETRMLVPSPRDVGTTTRSPRCPPREVADALLRGARQDGYRFAVVNFANPDMVGHTGVIPAVVKAVETADALPRRRWSRRSSALGGVCLITADHGNAEQMLEADGVSPHTAHTTNPVPLIVTDPGARAPDGGELSDLCPPPDCYLGLAKPLRR